MAFGDRLKMLLEKLTDNKAKGVGVGALVTAIIQSSSITTVTLVGLINAGLITLSQAVPVIMGANIGTTITAQLIAFKVGKYSLPIIALGFLLTSVAKKDRLKYAGRALLGFGLIFLGMNLMSGELKHFAEEPHIMEMLASLGKNPIQGVLVGCIFTAIIQSSSATSGIVISMGMENLIDLPSAIALIFGANIGTCITVVIASVRSSLSSKRAAASHVLFNIIGVCLFFPFITGYANLIRSIGGGLPRQIANAHMIFNITVTLVLIWGADLLVKLVKKILPGEEIKVEKGPIYLDEHTLESPPIALGMAEKETIRMATLAKEMIESSKNALFEFSEKDIKLVKEKELVVDDLDDKIEIFMSSIETNNLSQKQQSQLAVLNHAIADIERIADHANNISEWAELRMNRKIKFSPAAFEELTEVFDKALESMEYCMKIIVDGDEKIIKKVLQIENEVDDLVLKYEDTHMKRLEAGTCLPEAGPIYLDVMRNLERITDHTHNIAYAKRFGF